MYETKTIIKDLEKMILIYFSYIFLLSFPYSFFFTMALMYII